MMCIPLICMFICMFVGLPSWVSVVCSLVVSWLKNVPFSFLLVSPFPALSESCIAFVVHSESCSLGRNVIRVGQKVVGVLCKRQQSFDGYFGMVIFYRYSLLCIIVDCQDDLYCGVHVPY